MRIAVTGAAGFLGSHVIEAVAAAGHVAIALVEAGQASLMTHLPVSETRTFDLLRGEAMGRALAGAEAVIHCAATLGDAGPVEPYVRVNAEGTRALCEAGVRVGLRRAVLVSSLAVHAFGRTEGDEETPRDMREDLGYARSKIAAEDVVMGAHRAGTLEGVVARPAFFPYGPRDRRALPPLIAALRAGRLPLLDGGRALTGTIFAPDLARGLVSCATCPGAAGEAFVLADDRPVTWKALLGALAQAFDAPPPRRSVPSAIVRPVAAIVEEIWDALGREPPVTRYRIDAASLSTRFLASKAKDLLCFEPTVTLAEGLARTAATMR